MHEGGVFRIWTSHTCITLYTYVILAQGKKCVHQQCVWGSYFLITIIEGIFWWNFKIPGHPDMISPLWLKTQEAEGLQLVIFFWESKIWFLGEGREIDVRECLICCYHFNGLIPCVWFDVWLIHFCKFTGARERTIWSEQRSYPRRFRWARGMIYHMVTLFLNDIYGCFQE